MANNFFFKSVLLSIFAVLLHSSIGKPLRPTTKATTSRSRLAVCQQLPDPGVCMGYIPRWYYNGKTKRCQTFIYGGCGGNDNNFLAKARCLFTCHTSKQQGFTIPAATPTNKQITTSKETRKLLDKKDKNKLPLLPTLTKNQTTKATKPCEVEKEKAMDSNQNGTFIPKCDHHGYYEPIQCWQAQKTCWCVDINGRKSGEVRTTNFGHTCDKIKPHKMNNTALAKSPCIKALKRAIDVSILVQGMQIPVNVLGRSYIPKCNSTTGLFTPKQCHKTNCWCVNIHTGAEIKNTYGVKNLVC